MLGSVVSSPVVVGTMLLHSLPVSAAWLLAVGIAIWAIGAADGTWLNMLQKSCAAIAIGLTPHLLFLVEINTALGPFRDPFAPGWTWFIEWYEPAVSSLQDRIGDYLMPSLLAGTALAVAMFLLSRWLDHRTFDTTWERLKDATRFAGTVLAAATTFTVCTGLPVGMWQPDARLVANARLAALVEAKARHGLYTAVLEELRAPGSTLAANVGAISVDAPSDRLYHAYEVAWDLRRTRPDASWLYEQERWTAANMERQEAREVAQRMSEATQTLDRSTEALKKEVAGICASAAGAAAEAFGGAVLGVLIEDAADRIARRMMAWSDAQDALRWVAGTALPRADELFSSSIRNGIDMVRELMGRTSSIRRFHEELVERGHREAERARVERMIREAARARRGGR